MKFLPFILFILFLSTELFAYVQGRGVNGNVVRWGSQISQITLYVKTANRQNVNAQAIFAIVEAAAQEWNNTSPVQIVPVLNTGAIVRGASNIYFSSGASAVFSGMGTGVLGVTQTLYDEDGTIVGGDVVINDSMTLEVNDSSLNNYLGNIITHELGHLLGLSHSEVKDSTMIYTALRGQNTLASDDKSGIYSLYPTSGKGKISGKVVGGESYIGILGTHVQAISRRTGKVMAGVYSDADGSFSIEGLDLTDSYYLYLSPASMLAQVPEYYSEAKKNFCTSGSFYRGSFFESCRSSESGFPQEIVLSSSQMAVDIGLVTIHCDLAVSSDYLSRKPFVANDPLPLSDDGKTLSGFFTKAEITQGKQDVFQIDLRTHAVVGSEFLELRTLAQSLYSRLIFKMQIKILDGSEQTYNYSPSADTDGNMVADYNVRIPLNPLTSKNLFEVTIIPVIPTYDFYSREQWNWGTGNYGLLELFPNASVMSEDLRFYLFAYSLSRQTALNSYTQISTKNTSLSDNTACPDGPQTYKVAATSDEDAFSTSRRSKKLDQGSPIACGTVGPSDGGGSGPLMLVIGLVLTFALRLFPWAKRPWIPARPIS